MASGKQDDVCETSEAKNGDSSYVRTLEERYITLLEERVKRLEALAEDSKDVKVPDPPSEASTKSPAVFGPDLPKSPTLAKDTKGIDSTLEPANEAKSEEPKKVRYINRELLPFGEFNDVEEKNGWEPTSDKEDKKNKDQSSVISWRRTKVLNETGRQELVIESQPLKDALKTVLEGTSDVILFDANEVVIAEPYAVLYHNEDKIRKYAEDSANDEAARQDVKLLLDEVQKEQGTVRKDAETHKKNGVITYDLLWTLFRPGSHVLQRAMDDDQLCVVANISIKDRFDIWLWAIDWTGNEFRTVSRDVSIEKFTGTKQVTELKVYPLEMWKDLKDPEKSPEDLVKGLEERGRKFESLCTGSLESRHRQYSGMSIRAGAVEMWRDHDVEKGSMYGIETNEAETGAFQLNLERSSFVMIDHYAYLNLWKVNTTTPLKVGQENAEWMFANNKIVVLKEEKWIGTLPKKQKNSNKIEGRLSQNQLRLCPPRVLGFAVAQKMFVQLLVKNVEEDTKKEEKEAAFKSLELPKRTKETLKKLICEHTKGDFMEDLIPGKGKGLVVLLHGPPGVGKTLTAESLAILSGKPLYSVSMSDVGTSPITVELNLQRIFALATHWKAVLLFDEADVFLEARSLQDVLRNSLVSVLLRILEYFQGILFLTSNRVKTFDEAFQSRIHFAVQYRLLSETQRRSIWKLWFKRAGDDVDPDFNNELNDYLEDEGELIRHEKLNGRQIRNIFRSAMTLAKASPEGKLKWEHVNEILTKTLEFQNYMLQGEEMAKRDNLR